METELTFYGFITSPFGVWLPLVAAFAIVWPVLEYILARAEERRLDAMDRANLDEEA